MKLKDKIFFNSKFSSEKTSLFLFTNNYLNENNTENSIYKGALDEQRKNSR
ncbi:MAG: hypothetical protein ACD_79C00020G0003 [uncultured bacterium]|nr:MAG: hypothetical protein ACD_79C00020G0003 [uncultured bacterium]